MSVTCSLGVCDEKSRASDFGGDDPAASHVSKTARRGAPPVVMVTILTAAALWRRQMRATRPASRVGMQAMSDRPLPLEGGRGILRFQRKRVGTRIYHRTQNAPNPLPG